MFTKLEFSVIIFKEEKYMKIAIDVDYTVADPFKAWAPKMSDLLNTLNIKEEGKEHANHNFEAYQQNMTPQQIQLFKEYCCTNHNNGSIVYPTIEDADKFVGLLHMLGHEIYFISARNDYYWGDAQKATNEWLRKNNIPFDGLFTSCPQKVDCCNELGIDVLIDDTLSLCEEAWKNGIRSIYFVDKNQEVKQHPKNLNPFINSCSSWSEVFDTINLMNQDNKLLSQTSSTQTL